MHGLWDNVAFGGGAMTDVSLDVFWPRDFVGRTLSSHPLEPRGNQLWCRTCGVEVEDSGLHLMVVLKTGVEGLRDFNAPRLEPDRRESSIGFEDAPGGAR